eukprot:gnl/MRDRNA2_/MRDRNA2_95373_c0_seq1.p1 gnl/MRDRNA2_/MRDRNA2_95373_c0~~gnl/MRDRNA2_/MRDRNA2_95373_c0_seq1.p1  ORF type:complete len:465 (+),score=104.96 gnl/MRDRNA2_/MRDRNA2_95373_c0_seq1:78-1397(+)
MVASSAKMNGSEDLLVSPTGKKRRVVSHATPRRKSMPECETPTRHRLSPLPDNPFSLTKGQMSMEWERLQNGRLPVSPSQLLPGSTPGAESEDSQEKELGIGAGEDTGVDRNEETASDSGAPLTIPSPARKRPDCPSSPTGATSLMAMLEEHFMNLGKIPSNRTAGPPEVPEKPASCQKPPSKRSSKPVQGSSKRKEESNSQQKASSSQPSQRTNQTKVAATTRDLVATGTHSQSGDNNSIISLVTSAAAKETDQKVASKPQTSNDFFSPSKTPNCVAQTVKDVKPETTQLQKTGSKKRQEEIKQTQAAVKETEGGLREAPKVAASMPTRQGVPDKHKTNNSRSLGRRTSDGSASETKNRALKPSKSNTVEAHLHSPGPKKQYSGNDEDLMASPGLSPTKVALRNNIFSLVIAAASAAKAQNSQSVQRTRQDDPFDLLL